MESKKNLRRLSKGETRWALLHPMKRVAARAGEVEEKMGAASAAPAAAGVSAAPGRELAVVGRVVRVVVEVATAAVAGWCWGGSGSLCSREYSSSKRGCHERTQFGLRLNTFG